MGHTRNHRMEPEPEPDTEEGEPPEALCRTPSTYQEYIKYGISAKGLRHVATEFQIGAGTTTSDLCQLFIKARTLPPGWMVLRGRRFRKGDHDALRAHGTCLVSRYP